MNASFFMAFVCSLDVISKLHSLGHPNGGRDRLRFSLFITENFERR